MMKLNTLNLLNNNLKEHKSFELWDSKSMFAKFDYDEELKRYQCNCGYLTLPGVVQISKDETDERYIVWI